MQRCLIGIAALAIKMTVMLHSMPTNVDKQTVIFKTS